MINGKSVLGIIPARGGSKRILGKNIRLLCNKPLITWTIEAAIESKYIDRLIVSTDSEKIKEICLKWDAEVPFLRPTHLSTDDASAEEVILHTLKWLRTNDKEGYDFLILLQPTSPLRTEKQVDDSIEQFFNDPYASSLVSVSEFDRKFDQMKVIHDERYIENFNLPIYAEKGLKKCPKIYYLNGAIYLTRVPLFMEERSFYSGRTAYYLMDSESSIDIDTQFDLAFAEFLLSRRIISESNDSHAFEHRMT
jgi:N-acylneuraminate cytidylyltransferase/CMP-N,N'-diacetyllegionaminic acid synthase